MMMIITETLFWDQPVPEVLHRLILIRLNRAVRLKKNGISGELLSRNSIVAVQLAIYYDLEIIMRLEMAILQPES